jgi:MobA/MobL family
VKLDGLGAKTTLEWSDARRREIGLEPAINELLHVRERWALAANTALEQAHLTTRIDHRTLRAQGIDREPRPQIPKAAFEMERHGYYSPVAERIRADHEARLAARLPREVQAAPVLTEPAPAEPQSAEEIRKRSVENWLRYRQIRAQTEPAPDDSVNRTRKNDLSL